MLHGVSYSVKCRVFQTVPEFKNRGESVVSPSVKCDRRQACPLNFTTCRSVQTGMGSLDGLGRRAKSFVGLPQSLWFHPERKNTNQYTCTS